MSDKDYQTAIEAAETGLAEVEASLANEHKKREKYLERSKKVIRQLELERVEAERLFAEAKLQPVIDEVNEILDEAYLVAERLVDKPYELMLQRELEELRNQGVLALSPVFPHGVPRYLPFRAVHSSIDTLLNPDHRQKLFYHDSFHVFGFHDEEGRRLRAVARGPIVTLAAEGG